ncbi:MAG TPA: hypothetical protein VLJ17_13065 [Xanthobacteraceae bacterium]|nr:hypothetical protein [Xanthobacteraceae bacterium]
MTVQRGAVPWQLFAPERPSSPLLQWAGWCISAIRDFSHAQYAIETAEIVVVDQGHQAERQQPAPR